MGQEHAGSKARLFQDAVEQVAFDPTETVKAILPESQSPVVNVTTWRKLRLITATDLCIGMNCGLMHLRGIGHWPVRPSKGMSGAPNSVSDV